jgi:predicted nucleic acid-binding protein
VTANRFTVVFDACVLYPSPLRSFLMHLAMTDLFRAKWTRDIHEEWMRNVEANYQDIDRQQVERIRELMDAHVRDCLVTDYEQLIDSLVLPDPDDRHVLAAAVKCNADMIVTFNLKDFPATVLEPFGIEPTHPDDFIEYQMDLAPHTVASAAKRHRDSLKNPPRGVEDYLLSLERQGLTQTVATLRPYSALI